MPFVGREAKLAQITDVLDCTPVLLLLIVVFLLSFYCLPGPWDKGGNGEFVYRTE